MLRPIDQWYNNKEEPGKSCLQFMRQYILKRDNCITEAWKYGMPFFCYKEKMFCYLWMHKKFHQPYLGIVEGIKVTHPMLLAEKRARMKILLLDPSKNLPMKTINAVMKEVLSLYKK